MNLDDILFRASASDRRQFSDLPEPRAKALLRAALGEIVKEVQASESQPVHIPHLGVFRTNVLERDLEGKKSVVKRTVFRPAQKKVA